MPYYGWPGGRIDRVFIHGARGHGIHIKSGGFFISNAVISNCGGDGIRIGGADGDVDDTTPRLPPSDSSDQA